MARFKAREKKGFYPLPISIAPAIAMYLHVLSPPDTRILDPVAGEGEALHLIGQELGVKQLYANELDVDRAAACKKLPLQATCGDAIEELRTNERAYSVLYLNPPYDSLGQGKGRTEEKFLRTVKYLRPEGILVLVVQLALLFRKPVIRKLTRSFKDIRILRFPDEEYKAFGQVVLFGKRRQGICQAEERNFLSQVNNLTAVLGDPLPITGGKYTVPPSQVDNTNFFFYTMNLDEDTPEKALQNQLVRREMEEGFEPAEVIECKPLMPLRTGHIAMLLASGMLDGVFSVKGHIWAVAGRTVRKDIKYVTYDEDDKEKRHVKNIPMGQVLALDLTSSIQEGQLVVRKLE